MTTPTPPSGPNRPVPPAGDPTTVLPQTPPTGHAYPGAAPGPDAQPGAAGGGTGTPGTAPHDPDEGKNKALPWMIATGVLAACTVGFAVWGFMTNNRLNDLQSSTDQQIAALTAEVAKAQDQTKSTEQKATAVEAKQAREIEKLKAETKDERAKLKIDTGQLKTDSANLSKLAGEYKTAQANAQRNENNLKAQLTASQAQAALAKKCAQVLGGGLLKIYADVPTVVTYKEVNAVITAASNSCGTVVALNR